MEEDKDLEILEDFLEYNSFLKNSIVSDNIRELKVPMSKDEYKAIQNLIARYKEQEEIINHQSKSLLKYQNAIPKSKVQEEIEDLEKRGYFEEANAMKDLLED